MTKEFIAGTTAPSFETPALKKGDAILTFEQLSGAVEKAHDQGTDQGTSSTHFTIGAEGVILYSDGVGVIPADPSSNKASHVGVHKVTSCAGDDPAAAQSDMIVAQGDGAYRSPNQTFVRAYKSAAQNIANDRSYQVTFDHKVGDPLGEYSTSTNTFRAKYGGVYIVSAQLHWNFTSPILNPTQTIRVRKNGADVAQQQRGANGGVDGTVNTICVALDLAANDTVQIWADNNDGLTQAIRASVGGYDTFFTITKVG